jgi:hypothetical protein
MIAASHMCDLLWDSREEVRRSGMSTMLTPVGGIGIIIFCLHLFDKSGSTVNPVLTRPGSVLSFSVYTYLINPGPQWIRFWPGPDPSSISGLNSSGFLESGSPFHRCKHTQIRVWTRLICINSTTSIVVLPHQRPGFFHLHYKKGGL